MRLSSRSEQMLDHGAFVAGTQTYDLSIDFSMASCSRVTNGGHGQTSCLEGDTLREVDRREYTAQKLGGTVQR
jgi:hypothetical protein